MGPGRQYVGIDLGTTFSVVAHVDELGRPAILPIGDGERLTPSVVLFDGNRIIVGSQAAADAAAYPGQVARLFKPHMGDPDFRFSYGGKSYNATELSGLVLQHLKRSAEERLRQPLPPVVLTVPAYFGDPQRRATLEAARIAGLQVSQLINEPTAAGYAYGLHRLGATERVLVFDLGGGTFDVSVIDVQGDLLKVVATGGDHQLGGSDWDEVLARHLADKFRAAHGIDPLSQAETRQTLIEKTTSCKKALTSLSEVTVSINAAGRTLSTKVTRKEFEQLTAHLTDRCRLLTEMVLEDAGIEAGGVNRVLLVGGAARMPMIGAMLESAFGKPPSRDLNPDEAVAMGAAVKAALLAQADAAHLAHGPAGARGLVKMRDVNVTSHSFGVVVLKDGVLHNSIIIPRNTPYPCEKSRSDYSVADAANTGAVRVILTEGENPDPYLCNLVGQYEASGLANTTRDRPVRLQFTYRYNANQVVEVEAHDLTNGRKLPTRALPGTPDLSGLQMEPMDVMLAMDCSGSMTGHPLACAKAAALAFVDNFAHPGGRIGLVTFPAGFPRFLGWPNDILRAAINEMEADDGTPMDEALTAATTLLLEGGRRTRVIILMTDGSPDDQRLATKAASEAARFGIRIITVGTGFADEGFLASIASTPADYHKAGEPIELSSVFTGIATELSGASGLSRPQGR